MNIEVNGHNIFEIVFVTFLISLLLVPLAKVIAKHIGAMDMPNERKVHTKPMPRLGGLAIIAGFTVSIIYLLIVLSVEKSINLLEDNNNNRGTTIIMATHDRDIVNTMKKRVVCLNQGVLVSDQKKGKYIEHENI